jgi:hypothetical protein
MHQVTKTLGKTARQCRDRLDWVGLSLGLALVVVGGFLSLTIIGIVIGAPLIVAALPLLTNPRHEACT